MRKFGFIKVEKSNRILFNKHLSILGPDPLSQNFNLSYLRKKLKKENIFERFTHGSKIYQVWAIYMLMKFYFSLFKPKK